MPSLNVGDELIVYVSVRSFKNVFCMQVLLAAVTLSTSLVVHWTEHHWINSWCHPLLCKIEQLGYYRSAFNVGRFLYRVATLRNIAKDLLRTLMTKNLIEYF